MGAASSINFSFVFLTFYRQQLWKYEWKSHWQHSVCEVIQSLFSSYIIYIFKLSYNQWSTSYFSLKYQYKVRSWEWSNCRSRHREEIVFREKPVKILFDGRINSGTSYKLIERCRLNFPLYITETECNIYWVTRSSHFHLSNFFFGIYITASLKERILPLRLTTTIQRMTGELSNTFFNLPLSSTEYELNILFLPSLDK